MCGTYTGITRTEGQSVSRQRRQSGSRSTGTSDTVSEQELKLVTVHDVMTRLRPDAAFLKVRGQAVAMVSRSLWWRRDDMRDLVKADPFRRVA